MQIKQCIEIERHFESRIESFREQIDLASSVSVSSLRRVELSFALLQKDAHHCIEKVEKEELHERQDIQIDRLIEHFRQNAEIDHRAAY
jgi:uncharacterized protein with PIN domain